MNDQTNSIENLAMAYVKLPDLKEVVPANIEAHTEDERYMGIINPDAKDDEIEYTTKMCNLTAATIYCHTCLEHIIIAQSAYSTTKRNPDVKYCPLCGGTDISIL